MFSKKKKEQQEFAEDTELDFLPDDELSEKSDAALPQQAKKKLPGWVIVPIVGVILLAAFISSRFTGGETDTATALTVTEASIGTVKEVYNSSGTIESENTKTYYSPVTAPVTVCSAVAGQTVRAGDLLISYDTTNLERDNQQAQLSLQSSRNTSAATRAQNARAIDAANAANAAAADQANALADQVNQLADQVNAAYDTYLQNQQAASEASSQIQAQRESLQSVIDENSQILAACQSLIETTESGYAGRRPEADAAKTKPEDQRTPEEQKLIEVFEQYDEAQKDKIAAQTALDQAESDIAALIDPSVDDAGYAQLRAQYDAAYTQWEAASAAAQAETADAGMSSAELANLDISDNLAELSALTPAELVAKGQEGMKADMNGVIASVDALEGTSATQGSPMFTIASMDNVRVKLEVSPDDYSKLKEGNSAVITVGEKKYDGTVTKINKIAAPNAKGNPVIGAEVHINNPDTDLCIGATAKVSMTVAEAKDAVVVPTEVINTSSDGDFVYVIENGVVKEKPVEVGTSSTTQIEILSGLKKGDQVVSELNVDIREGMKATAVPAAADTAGN